MKSIEEIREAFLKIHHKAIGRTKDVYMSVPANPDKDADCIVLAAIEELMRLRVESATNASFARKAAVQLEGWAKLLGLTDYYTSEKGFFYSLSDHGRESALAQSALGQQLKRLETFKAYVHNRLDELKVPTDPDPEETKRTGCRVATRMDHLAEEEGRLPPKNEQELFERIHELVDGGPKDPSPIRAAVRSVLGLGHYERDPEPAVMAGGSVASSWQPLKDVRLLREFVDSIANAKASLDKLRTLGEVRR